MRRQNEFHPRTRYSPADSYRFLPFNFSPFDAGRMLLVNEVGEHQLLSNEKFTAFIDKNLPSSDEVYLDLKGKHFLYDSDSIVPFELLAIKYRTKKQHLAGFVKLHIFVVSLRCEHSCHYCQVSRVSTNKTLYDMSPATALKALDLVFSVPAKELKIEFQGGEPLLNFEVIRLIVETAKEKAESTGKIVEFVITTNLALITDEILDYCRTHRIWISTSLDGPAFVHNANRPRRDKNSYELTIDGINRVRASLGNDGVSALMTTTKLSLSHPREIIDEYLQNGFNAIFLRSLSPYGFAAKTEHLIGYTVEEFLRFYTEALAYIIDLNRRGIRFVEIFAQIILTRILTPFSTGYVDLQSPAGAGIGVVVYNYDGDVYASDEARMLAEMNDTRFKLGNAHTDSYENIFGGQLLREIVASSNVESIPVCSECVFQSYCGSDPVFHYATQGDLGGYIPSSDFHRKHFFIIKHLLELYHSDNDVKRIFHDWIRPRGQVPVESSDQDNDLCLIEGAQP
jgi:His-Xaa-Ser system radical SAM maturase HxsB